MLRDILIHNRFFTFVNAAAVVIALVAAMANVFVGPFNAVMWFVPAFMAGFAVITSFLVQGALLQAERPWTPNWTVRTVIGKRRAKQLAYFLRCYQGAIIKTVSPLFLYFTPSLFLIVAIVQLILSVRGQITPGN